MDEQNKVAAEIEEIDTIPAEEDENVSRETDGEEAPVTEETGESAQEAPKTAGWTAEYRLTEEEMCQFVDCSGLISSKRRTIIESFLAAVLAIVNGVNYATADPDERKTITLFLCVLCAVLCGAVVATRYFSRRSLLKTLKESAENGAPTWISGDGTSLRFGAEGDVVAYDYDRATVSIYDDLAVILLSDGQMVCVPHRALSDEAWDELCAHKTVKK